MNAPPMARRRASTFRRVGWLAVAAMTTLALVGPAAGPVAGASVAPIPIDSGNLDLCRFRGRLRRRPEPGSTRSRTAPGNGTVSVSGFGTITVTNFVNSTSETPGSFDWSVDLRDRLGAS